MEGDGLAPQQSHRVRCETCEKEFGVKVGWQAYDERVWLRYVNAGRRRGALMRVVPLFPKLAGSVKRWEMKIPLRVRWCGDHAEGTQGCKGRLWRVK